MSQGQVHDDDGNGQVGCEGFMCLFDPACSGGSGGGTEDRYSRLAYLTIIQ